MRSVHTGGARRWRRATATDEAGMAMIVVMSVMVVLVLLTTAAFSQAVAQLPLARHDQDHEAALHAAESGVDDYINHLNANNNYFNFSAANPDTPTENPAFLGWVLLPGSAGLPTNESYRYSVDNTGTVASGIVYLTSSGCAAATVAACLLPGAVVRTVKVGLRKVGFLDFVYFTDYEIFDIAITGLPGATGNVTNKCNYHEWEYNTVTGGYGPAGGSNCNFGGGPEKIEFISADTLNGPVHSNDAFHMCGTPTFLGTVDSGNDLPAATVAGVSQYAGPGQWVDMCPTSAPNFAVAGNPTGSIQTFPATNLQLSSAADASQVGGNGCLYYGQTTINFHMLGATPVFDVTNPYFAGSGGPAALVPTRPNGPPFFNCGTTASHTNLPVSAGGTNFNGVIYVENVPAASVVASGCTAGTTCNGDIAVQGTLGGQLTIGADDHVTITGNILYTGPAGCNAAPACALTGTDVLGLVGGNDIIYEHPTNCDGSPWNAGCHFNLTVDAALLSVKHSIYVENWASGVSMGLLTINGTLAQKYRGVVGTGGGATGYLKRYNWDPRLRYLSPPFFLNPAQSSWEHLSFAELTPKPIP
jgi:hypothetical protein